MKTVIFDMDGVLVDSEYTFLESKTNMLREAGYNVDESYQYQFMGTTSEFMWGKMKEELHLPLSISEYISDMNFRREEMIKNNGVRAINGVEEFVKSLHDKGYKLAVASSSPKSEIEYNLKELNLYSYFDELVSAEEVENSKPAPDVYLKAAKLLNSKAEDCIVFEDTTNGCKAEKAAGMYCFGFNNSNYPIQNKIMADQEIDDFLKVDIESIKL